MAEKSCNLSEPVEVEPVELVQINLYRKDLSWLHFNDELMVKKRQQVKDQQSCISIFVAYLTVPSSN